MAHDTDHFITDSWRALETLAAPSDLRAAARPVWLIGPPPFDARAFTAQPAVSQPWFPFAQAALPCQPPGADDRFARIVVFGSKTRDELRGMVHSALAGFDKAGNRLLTIVAGNKTGGDRLVKDLKGAGVSFHHDGKHHHRVIFIADPAQPALAAYARGVGAFDALAQRAADGLWSCPGLHGWDKNDAGSLLLRAQMTPGLIQGDIGDLGCGFGLLTHDVAVRFPGVTALSGYDADARALSAFARNVQGVGAQAHWCDLGASTPIPGMAGRHDVVVMNPPFHEGRRTVPELGRRFIAQARAALKPGGRLLMVANTHLPYEATLQDMFGGHETLAIQNGFKVLHAVRR